MSYQIAPNLHLVKLTIGKEQPKVATPPPTNHIAVIDCSGSMYGELPKVREQLKKKLPKIMRPDDTISIVWFSGKGQFGTLLEAEPVATLTDLATVNAAIDRWLKPVCLTGFKEPLEEATRLIERISKKRPGTAFALLFMSDGCDNQWNRQDILKVVEAAAGKLAATTIVEYGYYADRPLLTAMAEKAGGSLVFAQDFDAYAPAFESAMQRKLSGVKKIEVTIPGDPVGGFAFATHDGDLLTFGIEAGKTQVPEGITDIWYVSPTAVDKSVYYDRARGDNESLASQAAAYAALSLFSVRMKPEIVLPILKMLGDVAFIEEFGGLFGKQRYSAFMDAAKLAAFDATKRLVKGYDPSKVPADDAFTVLDLLQLLASDDGNKLLLDHPEFKYSRIGRAQLDASANLTADEQAELAKLQAEMTATKDAKLIGEIATKIAALTASKQEALKFTEDKSANPDGYAISNLTYNEERPNISVLVRKSGTVDLTGRLKDGEHAKVPRAFPTFIFRNYAIVRDGLVNVAKLPVKVSDATFDGDSNQGVYILDLSRMPIINRLMVKAASAKTLFEKEYALTVARAAQKVYNAVRKEKFPRTSEGFEIMYGPEATAWLKEQGFTDYSGFGPKRTQAEARDFYMGKFMTISLKGLSTIPSMNEFKKQAAKGKLNAGAQMMAPVVKEIEDFLASDVYTKAKAKDALFEAWLEGQGKAATATTRALISEMARTKFAISIGQVWFTEFASLDECSLEITVDGNKIQAKVEMVEKKIDL
jgi:hypothetical protein